MPTFTPYKTRSALLIGAMFSVAAYAVFFLAFYSTWHRFAAVAHHGRPAVGVVIEKQPSNHLGVRFQYSVDGTKYFGEAAAGMDGLPKFEQIQVGDKISVTYRPERPSDVVAGNSRNAYRGVSFLLFVLLPGACLILGGMAALGLCRGTTFTWLDLIRFIKSKAKKRGQI